MKPLPGIYRDVHPDREPVDFGVVFGVGRVYDLDSRLMDHVRRRAEAQGEPFAEVLLAVMEAALDAWEEKGGTL